MKRIAIGPRPNWEKRLESTGFTFHSIGGEPYWNETVFYHFTAAEIDQLERATNELQTICTQAVQWIIDNEDFDRLKIPPRHVPFIVDSWNRDQRSLYGRFDLAYDGISPPRLLEYNADTPTSILEAAVAQWFWLQDVFPRRDQFNSIHEKLIARWRQLEIPTRIHFSCLKGSEEDLGNLTYLRDTATQAGLQTQHIYVEDIGWNRQKQQFVDLDEVPIECLFKLYPWEWMFTDQFAPMLQRNAPRIIEPPWKLLLSNKGILPILWELFPSHPNLLPAYFEPGPLGISFVKKPFYSREGANVVLHHGAVELSATGDYGEEGYVFQKLNVLPRFDDYFAVIGSWIIGEDAAGIGIREDRNPITKNTSQFVPHCFE